MKMEKIISSYGDNYLLNIHYQYNGFVKRHTLSIPKDPWYQANYKNGLIIGKVTYYSELNNQYFL